MNIIVCMKQVPDPEGSRECFAIDPAALRVEPRGIPPVLSVFDENALEAALRVKEAQDGRDVRITVLSVGRKLSNAVLQKALAVGADEVVKIDDEALGDLDSQGTATVLAAAIGKIGNYTLVLTGRQAADWNAGQVGVGVAHLLGLPVVTLVRRIDVEQGHAVSERITADGYEVVRTPLPAVFVVSNEVGEMRYPTLMQRRDAKKKPVVPWSLADIRQDRSFQKRLRLRSLFAAAVGKRQCELIEGATPAEAGRKLAHRLRRDGLV